MRDIMAFKIQRHISIVLASLLAISIAMNMYAYLKTIVPSPENDIEYGTNTLIVRDVQGGMGTLAIAIEHRVRFSFEYEMLYVSVPRTFNLSIMISLWEPYTGTSSYPFTIKLYERPLYGQYSNTSTLEKDVIAQKDKDAMYVNARTVLTITAPPDTGIYIYKIAIEGTLVYEVEFPILAV